jgi:hypothetical protein
MEQLFILSSAPFCFLNAGVKPLKPTSFALLAALSMQKRSNPRPLVLAIFHDSRLQDFILGKNNN